MTADHKAFLAIRTVTWRGQPVRVWDVIAVTGWVYSAFDYTEADRVQGNIRLYGWPQAARVCR